MTQSELNLYITLGVLVLVLIGILSEYSLKRLLLVVVCVLIYWCGYSLYNIHSAKQQMEQLQGNLENSINNLSGNLGENNHGPESDKKQYAQSKNGDGGIVYWTDATGQHGLMADDHDLGHMNFAEAKRACEAKGNGWHLPTKEELQKLYENKDKVSGLKTNFYWSSSEDYSGVAWGQRFSSGFQADGRETDSFYVRAVRAF